MGRANLLKQQLYNHNMGMKRVLIYSFFIFYVQCIIAQDIISFNNGYMTWTNGPDYTNLSVRVDWTHALTNQSWETDYSILSLQTVTGPVMSLPIPMFFRLAYETNESIEVNTGYPVSALEDGYLVWTNGGSNTITYIQWSLDNNNNSLWYNDWPAFVRQFSTGDLMFAETPGYFRIAQDPHEWIPVNDLHNAADSSTGYGMVNYPYCISRYEISNEQYADFLNKVDPIAENTLNLYNENMNTDPRGGLIRDVNQSEGQRYIVKTNMNDKPVVYVSFWDAVRYVNWIENGSQHEGETEQGTYNLISENPDNLTVTRNPGARYFIPNEHEWYKAAYFDNEEGQYWLYSCLVDSAPTKAQSDDIGNITNDTAHLANYDLRVVWGGVTGNVSTVGSGGTGSESYYGVADMGGNVSEWIDAIVNTNQRIYRGGSWLSFSSSLRSSTRVNASPHLELSSLGFRIACIYNPITNSISSYTNYWDWDGPPLP